MSPTELSTSELAGFSNVLRRGPDPRTVLLLHGTGGDEYDLLEVGSILTPSATLLSPRGRAPEGQVNRWFARFAPGVLDEDDIIHRAAQLKEFVQDAVRAYGLDEDQIIVAGYSNGANMAAAMLLLYPTVFAGAVLLRPMLPLKPERTPDLSGRRIYIAAGLNDTMIPEDSTRELIVLLEESGAEVTVTWAATGHRIGQDEIEAAHEWLEARS